MILLKYESDMTDSYAPKLPMAHFTQFEMSEFEVSIIQLNEDTE